MNLLSLYVINHFRNSPNLIKQPPVTHKKINLLGTMFQYNQRYLLFAYQIRVPGSEISDEIKIIY